MVERVRARPWGVVTAALAGEDVDFGFEAGDDDLDVGSLFQVGSVTKTMTGVLLADAVVRGEVTPDAALGDVLDVRGAAATITLEQLATQRSGLPRLPANLDPATVDQADPYANYTADDLRDALEQVTPGPREYLYSNFGFMTLGLALANITRLPMSTLLEQRMFAPLGMATAGCPPKEEGRVPGYNELGSAGWWTTQLPGAGGVGASITDLAAYLGAHLAAPDGPLGEAITLATTVHAGPPAPSGYGWGSQGGGWWHNGGTGGFRSFVALHRPTRTAVALLANSSRAEHIDGIGLTTLTEMVRAASAT